MLALFIYVFALDVYVVYMLYAVTPVVHTDS